MERCRKDAIAANEPWYVTGKPCKYGHYSKRSTIDGACVQCRIENTKEERAAIRTALSARD